jgi:hypothetical protein
VLTWEGEDLSDEELVRRLQADRMGVGGGEFGPATTAAILGDAVEYGPGDRFLFTFGPDGYRAWIAHPDGTTTDLPDPPMPEGVFLPPADR